MALVPRLLATTPLVLALLTATGCSADWVCTDSTAERGHADAEVEVLSVYGDTGVTAAIEEWHLEPHPQTPDDGDMVFYAYRFSSADTTAVYIDLDLCAVDADRVALACATVSSAAAWEQEDGSRIGEDWLAVEHPERVAAVLLVPNDQSEHRPDCDADAKDGAGVHPPEPVAAGDRL